MFISQLLNHTLTIVVLYGTTSVNVSDKLQMLQNRAARVITGADHLTPINELLSKLGWSNLKKRKNEQKALYV